MRYYSIRMIMKSPMQQVYGITIPEYLFQKYSGTSFTITEDPIRHCLILESGCELSKRKEMIPNRLDW